MADDTPQKVFSEESVNKLIRDSEDESKLLFDSPRSEYTLAMFLLVRRAFNEAYDRIKESITSSGVAEVGESFSGVTGAFVRGTRSERGGSKYQWMPTGGEELDPEFVTAKTVYSVDSKAVDKYLKKYGELPPGIEPANRSKSLSLQPTKEAKAFFDQRQEDDAVVYNLEVGEVEDE